MLQSICCVDSLRGVNVHALLYQVLQLLVSVAPVNVAEWDWSRAIFVVPDGRGLVGCRHLVEDDTETEHIDVLLDWALAELRSHIAHGPDTLHIELAVFIDFTREPEVAKLSDVVLLNNLWRLLQNILKFDVCVDNAFSMHVVEAI